MFTFVDEMLWLQLSLGRFTLELLFRPFGAHLCLYFYPIFPPIHTADRVYEYVHFSECAQSL